VAAKIAARLQRRNWERERRKGEKFGQHGVSLKIDAKTSRGASLLREEGK
jgi:hypothetical protein